jgi:hypothetical protein
MSDTNPKITGRKDTDAISFEDINSLGSGAVCANISPSEREFALKQWRALKSLLAQTERRIEEYQRRYDFKD